MYKSRIKSIQRKRNQRIDQAGTAPLVFLNTADIAQDTNQAGWIIDFTEESKTERYSPFDFLSINNSSSEGLNLYINQRNEWQKIVRSGSILPISDYPGIRGVRIAKRGTGTIAAGEVEVTVMRKPLTQDELVRREASASPFKGLVKKLLGV